MDQIAGGVTVFIIFLGFSSPIIVIGLVHYFLKRLEHKKILAAIEKGVPVSELGIVSEKQKKNEGPGWIRDQSKGITLLIIGIGIAITFWLLWRGAEMDTKHIFWIIWIVPIVFLANGTGLLIRSRQRKKYEKPAPAEELSENNTD